LKGYILSNIKSGDTVKVHYTGTLKDGTIFDSSKGREPLEFVFGQGQLIPGFEKAVESLNPGDLTKVNIPYNEAYGEVRGDMIVSIERDKVPTDIKPEIGLQLQIQQPNGQPLPVVITDVSDSHIVLDANHPLAGKDLTFEIELVSVS
jgi:peptidylprolyl isomerase